VSDAKSAWRLRRQPLLKGAFTAAFQDKQDTQRRQFTGVQQDLRKPRDTAHVVIYATQQSYGKVYRARWVGSSLMVWQPSLGRPGGLCQTSAIGYGGKMSAKDERDGRGCGLIAAGLGVFLAGFFLSWRVAPTAVEQSIALVLINGLFLGLITLILRFLPSTNRVKILKASVQNLPIVYVTCSTILVALLFVTATPEMRIFYLAVSFMLIGSVIIWAELIAHTGLRR
jgi:hypothetical protein